MSETSGFGQCVCEPHVPPKSKIAELTITSNDSYSILVFFPLAGIVVGES